MMRGDTFLSMWLHSIKLILRKHWLIYTILFVIGFLGALITYITFPGEEGIQALLGMADTPFGTIWGEFIRNLDSENSAFFLYFIYLYFIAYMANIYPIIGVWLGGAGTPNEVKSGMADIFIASPHKKGVLIGRHLITHLILLTLFTSLIYALIPLSYNFLGASINYDRVFLAFILLWISGVVFFSIAFFITSVTLNGDIGRGIAGIIFLLSFLMNSIVNMNSAYEDLQYLNILHYTNPNPILIMGEILKINNFIPLLLSGLLFICGTIVFISRDPLPLQLNRNRNINEDIEKEGSEHKFLKKIKIEDYIQHGFQKFSSISAEQWVADRTIFLIFAILCFFGGLSIIAGFPTGEGGFAEMSQIYRNNPLVKAIVRDSMELIINDPLGPIYPQFYGYTWLYFFPFVIIQAGRVLSRDKNSETIDLILGTPITPKRLIIARVFTIMIELTILTTMTLLIIIIGEFYLGINSKLIEQLLAFIIIPFTYGTILCFFIAVALLMPSPNNRKRMVYALGAFTVICVTIPYFSEPLLPLRFLSLLYYMDLIGLIVQGYQFEHVILLLVLLVVLMCSLTVINRVSDRTSYV